MIRKFNYTKVLYKLEIVENEVGTYISVVCVKVVLDFAKIDRHLDAVTT